MTDSEIIKALECCGRESCNGCPYRNGKCHQGNPMIRDARDLINRQRALIEAMTQSLKAMSNIAKAERHEAYKVFADRVIDLIYDADDVNPVSEWQIRNLVKEMVGADDEQKRTNI